MSHPSETGCVALESGKMCQVRANAKITLTVDVLRRLLSEYHEIEAVMQEVDFFDAVYLRESKLNKITVTTTCTALPADSRNLAWKAANEVRAYCGVERGVYIHVEKRIPIGSGLAGGSSDAAAVIRGLNNLWGLGLSLEEMLTIGEKVSMDTCFCLVGGVAMVKGKGEIVCPVISAKALELVIANPGFPIMTREAYTLLDWTRVGKTGSTSRMIQALESGDASSIGRCLHNDFECSILSRYPVLSEVKRVILDHGALGALLSGSGSSIFGILSPDVDKIGLRSSLDRLCNLVVFTTAVAYGRL